MSSKIVIKNCHKNCHQKLSSKTVLKNYHKNCHKKFQLKIVIENCHQNLSWKIVIENCHQKLSSKIVTKNCHQKLSLMSQGWRVSGVPLVLCFQKGAHSVSESVSDKVTYWAVGWTAKKRQIHPIVKADDTFPFSAFSSFSVFGIPCRSRTCW